MTPLRNNAVVMAFLSALLLAGCVTQRDSRDPAILPPKPVVYPTPR